jgi:hypothetical protein
VAWLVLFSEVEMKKLLAVPLVGLAVAYYLGYEPADFIPSFGVSNTPPPKVRHAAATEHASAPAAQPERQQDGRVVIAEEQDGSLEHRWTPYPKSSPTKP